MRTAFGAIVTFALMQAVAVAAAPRGEVHFTTSANKRVQSDIDQGVALLHNFQWSEAARAFESASRRDSGCAMCHWGQAMALNTVFMGWPTDADTARARFELQATRVGVTTPRER